MGALLGILWCLFFFIFVPTVLVRYYFRIMEYRYVAWITSIFVGVVLNSMVSLLLLRNEVSIMAFVFGIPAIGGVCTVVALWMYAKSPVEH